MAQHRRRAAGEEVRYASYHIESRQGRVAQAASRRLAVDGACAQQEPGSHGETDVARSGGSAVLDEYAHTVGLGVDREPAPWPGSASARATAGAPVNVPTSSTRRAPIAHISASRSRSSLTPPAIPGKASPSGSGSAARKRPPTGPSCTCPHTAQRRTRPAVASARHRRRDQPGRQPRTPPEVVCSGRL